MQRILIIGAGGHGQVIADSLLCCKESGQLVEPLGYLDDAPHTQGQHLLGLPVLGPLAALSTIEHDGLVVAIGDNRRRRDLFVDLVAQGERLVSTIHPAAIIGHDVTLGAGSMVCAGAIIGPGSRIGQNCIINTAATVDHHNQLGDHVHVGPGAHLGGAVWIGEGTLVGMGATVMPQRQVGAWSIIGAGSLVSAMIPDQVTAFGVPARLKV